MLSKVCNSLFMVFGGSSLSNRTSKFNIHLNIAYRSDTSFAATASIAHSSNYSHFSTAIYTYYQTAPFSIYFPLSIQFRNSNTPT